MRFGIVLLVGCLAGCDGAGAALASSSASAVEAAVKRTANPAAELQSGDLVFQILEGGQGRAVQLATGSVYTHVGIVFRKGDSVRVLEAVQPVKWTRFDRWRKRGKDGHFVAMRLADAEERITPESVRKLRRAGSKFVGRNYDAVFNWSDDRIYCSELVWKAYERGLGIRLGEPQTWSELDLSSDAVKSLAQARLGRLPNPDGLIVSPARLLASPKLVKVAAH